MSRLVNLLRAPTMQNTGSTARDHLASERTFLSWLRTGLGFIALGIGVERFSRLEASSSLPQVPRTPQQGSEGSVVSHEAQQQSSSPRTRYNTQQPQEELLVASLLGTGTSCIAYGTLRYFSNLNLLKKGLYRPAYVGAAGLSFAVACLAGGAWTGFARSAAADLDGREER